MSIPASSIVSINPEVLPAGGSAFSLNGLFLTQNLLMPTGKLLSFPSVTAVQNFFGVASTEAAHAAIYFAGFDNSTIKPNAMVFAPFNLSARAAWLQSGNLAGITLAELQVLTGTITLTINGTTVTSSSINMSSDSSFTVAAATIQAAFTGTVPTVTWDAVQSVFIFTSPTTGSASTISFGDSGTLSTALLLTSTGGATISQGAVADTPTSAMTNAYNAGQNWITFKLLFIPAGGTTDMEAYAAWSAAQNGRFLYVAEDTTSAAVVNGSTTCFGYIALQNKYNGVMCVSGDLSICQVADIQNLGTFVCGSIGAIDFSQANGSTSLAFRSLSVLNPTCNNLATANILIANGYNYYGSYATANNGFIFFYNGNLPGLFGRDYRLINNVWMNDQMQVALMTLMTTILQFPYNAAGYSLERAALTDPINAALNFGAIRTGVTLSAAQVAEVNSQSGVNAAPVIQTQGFYLQILDPGATVRAAGGSPITNFWYTDGGSVLKISLPTIDIQ